MLTRSIKPIAVGAIAVSAGIALVASSDSHTIIGRLAGATPLADGELPVITASGAHRIRPAGFSIEPPLEATVYRLWSQQPDDAVEALLPQQEAPVARPE